MAVNFKFNKFGKTFNNAYCNVHMIAWKREVEETQQKTGENQDVLIKCVEEFRTFAIFYVYASKEARLAYADHLDALQIEFQYDGSSIKNILEQAYIAFKKKVDFEDIRDC